MRMTRAGLDWGEFTCEANYDTCRIQQYLHSRLATYMPYWTCWLLQVTTPLHIHHPIHVPTPILFAFSSSLSLFLLVAFPFQVHGCRFLRHSPNTCIIYASYPYIYKHCFLFHTFLELDSMDFKH